MMSQLPGYDRNQSEASVWPDLQRAFPRASAFLSLFPSVGGSGVVIYVFLLISGSRHEALSVHVTIIDGKGCNLHADDSKRLFFIYFFSLLER